MANRLKSIGLVLSCVLAASLAVSLLTTTDGAPVQQSMLERVSESVVFLEVNGGVEEQDGGSCTGWMYTDTKLITAGHCTEHLLTMEACFYPDFDCKSPVLLTFLGADHTRDVALFELPEGEHRRPLSIGRQPVLGDVVYAVGYPGGDFNVTSGMHIRRRSSDDIELWDEVVTEWDQSTASIAPGSSGGALVNAKGELVGMTVGHDLLGRTLDVTISLPVDVIREGLKHLNMGTGKTTVFGDSTWQPPTQ